MAIFSGHTAHTLSLYILLPVLLHIIPSHSFSVIFTTILHRCTGKAFRRRLLSISLSYLDAYITYICLFFQPSNTYYIYACHTRIYYFYVGPTFTHILPFYLSYLGTTIYYLSLFPTNRLFFSLSFSHRDTKPHATTTLSLNRSFQLLICTLLSSCLVANFT